MHRNFHYLYEYMAEYPQYALISIIMILELDDIFADKRKINRDR